MSIVSQSTVEKILAEHSPEDVHIEWAPAPCFYCSGAVVDGQHEPFVLKDRGTGRDPFNSAKPCPECLKRNYPGNWGYGPQGLVLLVKDFEILMSGVKRSGKTRAATVWMVRGNPDEPEYDKQGNPLLVNWSYLYHPSFRGLVIRQDLKDLTDWRSTAEPYYANNQPPMKLVGDQFICEQTGARIYLGHLHDSSSWMRVMGFRELHRVWIDEATHIGDPSLYFKLMSSLTTTHGELRPQILLTTNWIGPGVGWIRERFLESLDYLGKEAKPFHSLVEVVELEGKKRYRNRIFINTSIQDNPHVRDYYHTLRLLPDKEQQIFLFGNPYAMEGTYFDIFRPHGPQGSEPENADHVIPRWEKDGNPEKNKRAERKWNPHWRVNRQTGLPILEPWWPRAMGGDWGYAHESAIYWACQHPETKQIILYREYAVSGMTPRLLGVEIARRTLPDLERLPGNAMALYFSHEAFGNRGISGEEQPLTIVELLQQGIAQVLGPDAAWIPDLEVKALERAALDQVHPGFEEKFQEYKKAILERHRKGITIRKASTQRVHGWQTMREMMMWRRADEEIQAQPDQKLYERLCHEKGIEEASEYLASFRRSSVVYPQVQIIEEACPGLIKALPKLQHADDKKRETTSEDASQTHFVGLDRCDAGRYLLTGFREQQVTPPLEYRRDEYRTRWREQHPDAPMDSMIQALRLFEQREQSKRAVVPIASKAGRLREQRKWIRRGHA